MMHAAHRAKFSRWQTFASKVGHDQDHQSNIALIDVRLMFEDTSVVLVLCVRGVCANVCACVWRHVVCALTESRLSRCCQTLNPKSKGEQRFFYLISPSWCAQKRSRLIWTFVQGMSTTRAATFHSTITQTDSEIVTQIKVSYRVLFVFHFSKDWSVVWCFSIWNRRFSSSILIQRRFNVIRFDFFRGHFPSLSFRIALNGLQNTGKHWGFVTLAESLWFSSVMSKERTLLLCWLIVSGLLCNA